MNAANKKTADSKLSHLEPGQIVRGIDLSAYRVVSKVAGPEGAVVKLANLQGEPVSIPADFIPAGPRMAHLASAMFLHLAFNRDFDLYISSYCERAGLPVPVGPDGKPFRWAEWFQSKFFPKLHTESKDYAQAEAVKDEAIHEMLFTTLAHRNILGQFSTAIKNFSRDIRKLPVEKQLTVYLVSNFQKRVEETNRKIKEMERPDEISMFQPGGDDEGEEFNVLDTEEHAETTEGFRTLEVQREVESLRKGFYEWIVEKKSEKAAKWFITLFDIYWAWVEESTEGEQRKDEDRPEWMPARRNLEPLWEERTQLSKASLYDYVGRLASLLERYIQSHRAELGESNIFVKLVDSIRKEREHLKKTRGRKPKQKAMPAHAALAALNIAGVDPAMEPLTGGSPAMSMKQLHQRISADEYCDACDRTEANCICNPCHCDKTRKQASTNSECEFIEWKPGEWYYVLEDSHAPKNAWDWREHATAYGPFKSEEEAQEHLSRNHANPGGSSTTRYQLGGAEGIVEKDEVLAKLIAEAPKRTKDMARNRIPNPFYRGRWGSMKLAKLLRGDALTPEMRQQVQNAFVYRWTSDNPQRMSSYSCDKCDLNDPYVNAESAEGHSHPTIPLQTDDEWVREHAFYFTNDGRLMARRSAEPAYLAGESEGLNLNAAVKTAYNPGQMAYVYQAALLCEQCGDKVKDELNATGKIPADPKNEASFDSDQYPKGPYPDGGGEADSPQHCDMCGVFLENPLTADGYQYLRETVEERNPCILTGEPGEDPDDCTTHEHEARPIGDEVLQEWINFYPEAFELEHVPAGRVDKSIEGLEGDVAKEYDKGFMERMGIRGSKKTAELSADDEAKGYKCVVCGEENFTRIDGRLVCLTCHPEEEPESEGAKMDREHHYCPRCLECTDCNLRPCRGGGEHLPGVSQDQKWDAARADAEQRRGKNAAEEQLSCCGGWHGRHKPGCPVYDKKFEDTVHMLKSLPKKEGAEEPKDLESAVANLIEARHDQMLTVVDWNLLIEAAAAAAVGRAVGAPPDAATQLLAAANRLIEAREDQMVTAEEWDALKDALAEKTDMFLEWRTDDEMKDAPDSQPVEARAEAYANEKYGECACPPDKGDYTCPWCNAKAEYIQNEQESKQAAEPLQQLRPDITPGDTGRLPHARKEGAEEKTWECRNCDAWGTDSQSGVDHSADRNHGIRNLKDAAGPITPQQMQTQTVQQAQQPNQPPQQPTPAQPTPEQQPAVAIMPDSGFGEGQPMKHTVPPEIPNQRYHMSAQEGEEPMTKEVQDFIEHALNWGIGYQSTSGIKPAWLDEAKKLLDPRSGAWASVPDDEKTAAGLKTEQNTPEMEQEVETLIATHPSTEIHKGCAPVFEHGQWWVTCGPCGAIWSVIDATGGQSSNGLDLEEIETGDESCYEQGEPQGISEEDAESHREHLRGTIAPQASTDHTAASQAFDDAVFADKKRFFESVQHRHPKK